jgi:hypothetical protein
MAGRNGMRIGIALGEREAVGVILGRRGAPTFRIPGSFGLEDSGQKSGMPPTFQGLKDGLDRALGASTEGASVHVVLLPPLADTRLVEFPPLRKFEVELVLGRDVAKHFLGANRPQVVGVRLPARSQNNDSGSKGLPVLAAASGRGFLEALGRDLREVGWEVSGFSPAHAAWVQMASGGKGDPHVAVLAVLGPQTHLVRLAAGDPVAVRQIASDDLSSIVDAAGGEPGRVLVLGESLATQGLIQALERAGFSVTPTPDGWAGAEEATAGQGRVAGVDLIPPTMAMARREKRRRLSWGMAVGAVVLVLASLGAHLWGEYRELGAIQAQRDAIRGQVAPLLLAQDSLTGLTTRVESMEVLSRSAPVWTRSLVELAALLPSDTYLTGLFASGDTVELEASGGRAGEAIQILREAGLFEDLRLQGLVERELEGGETVVERFRLWARLPGVGGEGGGS